MKESILLIWLNLDEDDQLSSFNDIECYILPIEEIEKQFEINSFLMINRKSQSQKREILNKLDYLLMNDWFQYREDGENCLNPIETCVITGGRV